MNLADLAKLGAFVPDNTVEVPVEWNGSKMVANVRKLSYGDHEAIGRSADGKSQGALILSKTLFLPDQGRLMSYEEAYQLHPEFAQALITAITESKAIAAPKA